jgi:hypothetical protein
VRYVLKTENHPEGFTKKWGNYNDAPPGWTKITQKELIQKTHFENYMPDFIETRQIRTKETYLTVRLYFYSNNTGVGIHCDYWSGKITYYRFGCSHNYRGLSMDECFARGLYHAGKCYHVSECSKCGDINSVDSSD